MEEHAHCQGRPVPVAIKNLRASLLKNTDIFHQAIYREEALSIIVRVDNRLEKTCWNIKTQSYCKL